MNNYWGLYFEYHIKEALHARAFNCELPIDLTQCQSAAFSAFLNSHKWRSDMVDIWMYQTVGRLMVWDGQVAILMHQFLFRLLFHRTAVYCCVGYTHTHIHTLGPLCLQSKQSAMGECVSLLFVCSPLCVPWCLPLQNNGLAWENLSTRGLIYVCAWMFPA